MTSQRFLKILNRQFWTAIVLIVLAGFLGVSRYILAIPLILEITAMSLLYRCPVCKKKFDIRAKLSELSYCPNCGVRLDTLLKGRNIP